MNTVRSGSFKDLLDNIDPEAFVDSLGVSFRRTSGRSGPQLSIKECPRCKGAGWKVYLNAETGLGSCFHGSCAHEPGFNLVTFTQHFIEGTRQDAIQRLADYAKMNGWISVTKTAAARRAAKYQAEITSDAFDMPESFAIRPGREVPYLKERGFSAEDCEAFGLRFCEEGVYRYHFEGKECTQNYAQRVIIPVQDLNGSVVTFQGRSVLPDADPRYLFPPARPATARYLFNAHRCIGMPTVIVGEGVFDVMATKKAMEGIPDVGCVGTFGMDISGGVDGASQGDQIEAFLHLKRHGLTTVVMMWDGSDSALKNACRAGTRIQKLGLTVKLAVLPKDKDPNEVEPEVVRAAYINASTLTPLLATRVLLGRR